MFNAQGWHLYNHAITHTVGGKVYFISFLEGNLAVYTPNLETRIYFYVPFNLGINPKETKE